MPGPLLAPLMPVPPSRLQSPSPCAGSERQEGARDRTEGSPRPTDSAPRECIIFRKEGIIAVEHSGSEGGCTSVSQDDIDVCSRDTSPRKPFQYGHEHGQGHGYRLAVAGQKYEDQALPPQSAHAVQVGPEECGEAARRALQASFAVKHRVGSGRVSVVYQATRRRDQKPVALKVLQRGSAAERGPNSTAAAAAAATARAAKAEFDILQRFAHPNVVEALDLLCEDGYPVIVLQPFAGTPLETAIRAATPGKFEEGTVRTLGMALLRGLQHIHLHAVVHGDVGPNNVLISTGGAAGLPDDLKIIDFGAARMLGSSAGEQQARQGMELYAAPEAVLGEAPSQPSDVWQVGLCLHLMLSGCLPQRRRWQPPRAVATLGVSLQGSVWQRVPEQCKIVLRRCLAIDKCERASAQAILDATEWFAKRHPGQEQPERRGNGGPERSGQTLLADGLFPASGSESALSETAPVKATDSEAMSRTSASTPSLGGCTTTYSSETLNSTMPSSIADDAEASFSKRDSTDKQPDAIGGPALRPSTKVYVLRPKREVGTVLVVDHGLDVCKVRMQDGRNRKVRIADVQVAAQILETTR